MFFIWRRSLFFIIKQTEWSDFKNLRFKTGNHLKD